MAKIEWKKLFSDPEYLRAYGINALAIVLSVSVLFGFGIFLCKGVFDLMNPEAAISAPIQQESAEGSN